VSRQRIAAYALVVDDAGRTLLVRGTNARGWWFLPGGGVEHGEHPEQAAIRETAEETGYTIALAELLVVDSEVLDGRHSVRLIYRGTVTGGDLRCEQDGSSDVARWIEPDGIAELPPAPFVARLLVPGT
jgi:ADP-ribose pyrophosphatase YjhB (NUDIX family)